MSKTYDVTIKHKWSTNGKSVIGVAKEILEFMENEEKIHGLQYPGQYRLDVNSAGGGEVTIVRTYQERV